MTALTFKPTAREQDHDLHRLVERLAAGDVRALARVITRLEQQDPFVTDLLRRRRPVRHASAVIGVTGYPGAGKSTLVDRLVAAYRRLGRTVGVLAVDVSSPLTGGALLGDRIRMQQHALDAGVYIRSMASRGRRGGLAPATTEALLALETAGFDVVLIETLGVGQDATDIRSVAHTVIAVLAPGSGDEVQAMKAGMLETAHVVVVNKGDLPDAGTTVQDLQQWYPTVLQTAATTGVGIPALLAVIAEHQRRRELTGPPA